MLISVRSASLWWSDIITDFFIWSFPSGTANSGLPAKNVGVLHAVYLSRNYICSILRSIRDQRRPEVICLDNSSIHFPHLRSWWWGKFSQLTESKRSQTPGDRRTYSQFTIVSEHVFRARGETCRAASRRFRASNPAPAHLSLSWSIEIDQKKLSDCVHALLLQLMYLNRKQVSYLQHLSNLNLTKFILFDKVPPASRSVSGPR